jgi:alkylresorcinol/alkylpyrone synthase
MSFIHAVATDLPPYRYSTHDIAEAAAAWLASDPQQKALFERLAATTKIENRNFALPLADLLGLQGAAERAKIFDEVGASLLANVIRKGLSAAHVPAATVGALISTSCSIPAIPAIDAKVVTPLGLSASIFRLPVFQYGCAGGAVGLALAQQLCESCGTTVLASVELCSLVYQGADFRAGNIVGSAIFGDGAACVVISREPGPLKLALCRSFLIPDTHNLMGYDIQDEGTHLRLDKEIPQALLRAAPEVISQFLASVQLSVSEIDWWLFHPGGVKILTSLEEAFGISRERSRWSWDSLRDYGNMSSASILFALDGFLREKPYKPGDRVIMLGVGPGLTLQVNLLECS